VNNATAFTVQCLGLTKSFGTSTVVVKALRGIDLSVRQGELLMLLGPSGCGKTTLLSIVSGILDPDAGQCLVLGRDIQRMKAAERVRFRGQTVGFVFQVFNLLPALTAAENVAIPLLLARRPRREALAKASRLLEAVGLGDRAQALPAELSGGQQQRVAIARALVHDPPLLICDEPTSNLDHRTGQAMMEILRDLAQRPNRTLIVVTHDTRILDFADRVADMDDGQIVDVRPAPGRVQ